MTERRRDAPPKWGVALARRLSARKRRTEVEGDLVELWAMRAGLPPGRRRRAFWRDVGSLVVLGARSHRHAPADKQSAPRSVREPRSLTEGLVSMFQDLRFSFRLIRRQPAFSALVVATLTLGIAASTAIFTICDRVLVRPLPYPDAARIVSVPNASFGVANGHLTVANRLRNLPVFSALGLYTVGGLNLGSDMEPARVRAASVSAGFFDVMGVAPRRGRVFDSREFLSAEHVVILSDHIWRTQFLASNDIVGRTIRVNSRPFVVIGVMPAAFAYPAESEVWIPESAESLGAAAYAPITIGRVSRQATLRSTEQALDAIYEEQRIKRSPGSAPDPPTRLETLQDELGSRARPTLLFLGGVVSLLLLATCANVAGLLLARLRVRARELSVRAALGARPMRLVRQVIVECAALVGLGAIGGLAAAAWATRAFVASAPAFVNDIDLVSLDFRFLAIGVVVAAICSVLFALGPALSILRGKSSRALRETRSVTGGHHWMTNGLLVGQIATALVLLTATSAALAVVTRLMRVDVGFANPRTAMFEVMLPPARYPSASAAAFVDRLAAELHAIPGVVRVSATRLAPGSTAMGIGTQVSDLAAPEPPANDWPAHAASVLAASPEYFRTMGIRLLAGRDFNDEDRAGAPPVVIVNDAIARELWIDPSRAIGQRLLTKSSTRKAIEPVVIGVVADVRLRGVARDPGRQVYLPLAQDPPYGSVTIAIEAAGDPAALLPAARSALSRVDADLPAYHVSLLRDVTSQYLATERVTLVLTGAFGLMALALCAIGLYGALSQVVAQRTREIGIRMALGANRARLRWSIVSASLRIGAAGVVVGLVASSAATRLIARFVPALDAPSTTAIIVDAVVLVFVAALAAWIPARRASAVDPLTALRAE